MRGIEVLIVARREDQRASGVVLVDGVEAFRAFAEYRPTLGAHLAYPWLVDILGRETVPQRFMTYDGALAEVKALALRQYDLAVSEQARARVDAELKELVEELTT